MLGSIERHLRLYLVGAEKQSECAVALRTFLKSATQGAASGPTRVQLELRTEEDIGRARTAARELAAQASFSVTGQTRLVTAVSELARNIVQYAKEGRIELAVTSAPAGIEIIAADDGPGIGNLDDIFAGNHRSKLGMGLGLCGVKRLAQRFEVKTRPGEGTTVTAFMRVV
jgi:serine/threonine-protein kinase RsbT